jgi:hypothetical protein
MEFMGISVGILALICALVLLFGPQGTRKILGWSFGLLLVGAITVGAAVWVWSTYQHGTAQTATTAMAAPLAIMPPPPPGVAVRNKSGEILVKGPDNRSFAFSGGTEQSAIENYMKAQYGAPGTPRSDCWFKEPGPWCEYRR